jgi:hypothetical protein
VPEIQIKNWSLQLFCLKCYKGTTFYLNPVWWVPAWYYFEKYFNAPIGRILIQVNLLVIIKNCCFSEIIHERTMTSALVTGGSPFHTLGLQIKAMKYYYFCTWSRIAQSVKWLAMGWITMSWFPGDVKRFFSFPPLEDQLWDPPSLLSSDFWELFPLCLVARADHLLLSSTKITNACNFTSISPYIFIVWYLSTKTK